MLTNCILTSNIRQDYSPLKGKKLTHLI